MADPKLTEKQEHLLLAIGRFIRDRGFSPAIRELGRAVEISSTSVVNYHLTKIKEAGYIQSDPMTTRSIVPTEAGAAWLAKRGVHVDPVRDRAQTEALEDAARLVVLAPTQTHLKALERALEAVAS